MTIQTFSLTKKFSKLTAVDSVSFSVEKGEIFGLLGPNGAGKTTLLSMLSVLLKPTSGSAKVCGHDIIKNPLKVRQNIGMVFQSSALDSMLTARENLQLHAMLFGVERSIRDKRIDEVLEWVDLSERQHDLVRKYSGGMKKRLEIARGLMHRPAVLFLDEPTVGLDPQNREHIWKYIQKLSKEEEMTVVLTTHYMEEADMLANRVALIDHGKIVELNSPSALKKKIGGDTVEIECFERCSKKALYSLTNLKYVKSVSFGEGQSQFQDSNQNQTQILDQSRNKSEQGSNKIVLVVEDASMHLQKILDIVGKIKSVQVRQASLNDVFLKYTGRAIRNESAQDEMTAYFNASRK